MIGVGVGVGVGIGFVRSPQAALSVVVSPSSLTWDGGTGAWFTDAFTATPTNAAGAPSYTWEIVLPGAGGSYFNDDAGPNAYAFNSLGNDQDSNPGTVTFRCTLTASNGSAVSNTVTVHPAA